MDADRLVSNLYDGDDDGGFGGGDASDGAFGGGGAHGDAMDDDAAPGAGAEALAGDKAKDVKDDDEEVRSRMVRVEDTRSGAERDSDQKLL